MTRTSPASRLTATNRRRRYGHAAYGAAMVDDVVELGCRAAENSKAYQNVRQFPDCVLKEAVERALPMP